MKTPSWAGEPFDAFIDYHKRIHNFYHLTIAGLGMIIHRARRLEELTAEWEKLLNTKRKDDGSLKEAREHAEMAKSEADNDFPTLHEQQTVALWSSLECLVEDFLTAWMSNEPSATRLEEVRKIRISISDYEVLQGSEKYRYLLRELERAVRSTLRHGSDKFESVLGVFGFSGEIEAAVKRNLLELESVRNVLLHRRGIVDSRFCQICPWVNVAAGSKLIVSRSEFERYFGAVFDYSGILLKRVGDYFAPVEAPATDKVRGSVSCSGCGSGIRFRSC